MVEPGELPLAGQGSEFNALYPCLYLASIVQIKKAAESTPGAEQ